MKSNLFRCFTLLIATLTISAIFSESQIIKNTVYAETLEENKTNENNECVITQDIYNLKITTGEKLVNCINEAPNIYRASVSNNQDKIEIQFDCKIETNLEDFIVIGSDNSIMGSISNEKPYIITVNLKNGENTVKIVNKLNNTEMYKFYINYKNIELKGLKKNIVTGDSCKVYPIVDGKAYNNVAWASTKSNSVMISKDGNLTAISSGVATIIATVYDENNNNIIGSLSVQFYVSGQDKYGWIKNKEDWYYIDEETKCLKIGWLLYKNDWYYFNNDGCLKKGWLYQDNMWYYLKPTGNLAKGWFKYDENWYYADENGVMKTGWIRNHGNWYYLNKNGKMQTSNMTIDGTLYKFNKIGELQLIN